MSAKIITKVIAFLLVIIILAAATLCFALHQPKFLAEAALDILKRSSPGILFKEITLESVHWSSWDKLELGNLHVKCQFKDVSYFLSAGHVEFDRLASFLGPDPVFVDVKNLAVVSDVLNISDLEARSRIYFNGLQYAKSEASLEASQFHWDQYSVEGFKADLIDHKGALNISDIQGRLYGGSLQGKGRVQYADGLSYDIHLQLKQLNTALIAQANKAFGQFSAVVEGAVNIQALKGKGVLIQADLTAPLGGSMKASLLRYLAQYVPQRKQIEDLIIKDADIALSMAQTQLTSIDKDNLSANVRLNSSSLNLNMKVKFDIHVDGGIEGLFEQHL